MPKIEKPTPKKTDGRKANGGARENAGRPAFEPTDAERKQVEALSGYGLPIDQIGALVREVNRQRDERDQIIYVIDGVQAGILKGTIRQEILNLNVPTFIIKNEKYKKIPFKIVAKVYGDIGASHLPAYTNSILNNRFLYTYGAGIDVLSYYDFVARFEYSFNQLGEKGLFLHVRRDF